MKLLLENWRKYLKEDLLNELIFHGERGADADVIAYGKDVWLFQSDEDVQAAYPEIAKDLELDEDASVSDFYELQEEVQEYERSDILFGRIEDGELQLFDSTSTFKRDPRSSILIKKLVKELGLQGVSQYASDGDGEEIRASKYTIKGEIGDTAYHGTSSDYLEGIFKLGLVPGEKKTNFEGISHPDAVFISTRMDKAVFHANHTAKKTGGDPVIIEMKIPDKNLLIPDYDVDVGAGDTGCYDYICKVTREKAGKYSKMKGDSFSLSKEFGIYGYKGRIPASFMKAYHISMNAQEEGTEYSTIDDFTEATPEEAKTYLYTKENYGYGSLEDDDFDDDDDYDDFDDLDDEE